MLAAAISVLCTPLLAQEEYANPNEDCIDRAARYRAVPPMVLRAIAWQESRMRHSAVSRNKNGTVDLGAFQINSIHLPRLAQEGILPQQLMDGSCTSAYVAAWHLKKQFDKYGQTWQAVGAYHSATPELNARYASQIFRIMYKWGVIPADLAPSPYLGSSTKSTPRVAVASAAKGSKQASRSK